MQLTTGEAARILRQAGHTVREGDDVPITGGSADSRRVRPGDLFAAYPGEHTDGNNFVDEAFAAGAVAAVCNRPPAGDWRGRTIAVVPGTVAAMAHLARTWREACPARVVGITGTVGKTTAKEFIAALLATRFATHRSEGNLNSREGLPLAILSLRRDHEVSVLEMAMDSRGEIAELCSIARPEIGVVLNVGLTHVSKLGSIEAIRAEKLSLAHALPASGTAVLNADDPRVASEAPLLACRVLTFGQAESAHLRVTGVADHGLQGVRFTISCGTKRAPVTSSIPGVHTIPAAAAGIAVALALGLTLDEAAAAASSVRSSGRMRILRGRSGATIIDDRYNSSPASLAGALRLLASTTGGRRVALLGPMAELGEFEEEEHRRAGALAASCCDVLAAAGEPCRALIEAARAAGLDGARWFERKEDAAAAIAAMLRTGDTVLVKASRGQAFETVLALLEDAP
jgi:UDP-N-acetylmuramoyl-tripeptide--D-alanyl-D-alanine ligase